MARILLVMHEPLGRAFAECAAHVLGRDPSLAVFDVMADENPDAVVSRLKRTLVEHTDEEVLILSDIFGATPFNIARKALASAAEQGVRGNLVTGTNLCMVLKALTINESDPEKLSEALRQAAIRGIVDAESLV
ncbi:MAG TPA: PTS sugar transporter subunit IIA [Burkholderiaceae bacterium]|nr:PTS sugar transporter subunit IIA [Burkholderiaceae bacterium]